MERVKLIIAIVWDKDAGSVIERLVAQDYRVTRVASTGGFLRRGMVTLLIGVADQRVQSVIDMLREMCSPPEPGQHGATIFVVDAPHFEQV
jgi:uncharacterized protein YaaQ